MNLVLYKSQEGFADLRPFFKDKRYVGADMRPGVGVDMILNLHQIDLPDESAGTVLIMETLEHTEFPGKAIDELYRILKPNGLIIISAPMNLAIHDYPNDYWRFTPEGFKSLLQPFAFSLVDVLGQADFPKTVLAVAFKSIGPPQMIIDEFIVKLKSYKIYWNRPIRDIRLLIKLFIPPIFLNPYRKIRDFNR